jgi:hypothetical protein
MEVVGRDYLDRVDLRVVQQPAIVVVGLLDLPLAGALLQKLGVGVANGREPGLGVVPVPLVVHVGDASRADEGYS